LKEGEWPVPGKDEINLTGVGCLVDSAELLALLQMGRATRRKTFSEDYLKFCDSFSGRFLY
jgi:hypothetical protein